MFAAKGGDFVAATVTNWSDAQITITIPGGAATGPVDAVLPDDTFALVAGATLLDADNGVASLTAEAGSQALQGQPITITVRAHDAVGQPLANKPIALSDGLTDTVRQTGPDGTVLFAESGYNPQEFVAHSGTAFAAVTLTWQEPPPMTLTLNVPSLMPPDGAAVTVNATLLNSAGQPAASQPVIFQTSGASGLQLSASQALTDQAGNVKVTVSNTGSDPFLISATADDYAANANVLLRAVVPEGNPPPAPAGPTPGMPRTGESGPNVFLLVLVALGCILFGLALHYQRRPRRHHRGKG
jgi:hypothetical protein